jgi:hypothetical protein
MECDDGMGKGDVKELGGEDHHQQDAGGQQMGSVKRLPGLTPGDPKRRYADENQQECVDASS